MDNDARDRALHALERADDPSIRMMAATALVAAPPEDDAVDSALLTAVCDADKRVRQAASESLVSRDPSRDGKPLVAAIRAAEGGARRPHEPLTANEIIEYRLGRLKSIDVAGVLLQAMSDDDPAVRSAVAPVLAQTRNPRATSVLLAALADPVAGVRVSVAYALIRVGEAAQGDLLRALTDDLESSVRAAAASALGVIGGDDARGALWAAKSSDSAREVRHAAARALRELRVRQRRASRDHANERVGHRGARRAHGRRRSARQRLIRSLASPAYRLGAVLSAVAGLDGWCRARLWGLRPGRLTVGVRWWGRIGGRGGSRGRWGRGRRW
jgi:HEAT repeat protein